MRTKITTLDGVPFVTPDPFGFPFDHIGECPPCCGAGNGFGERIVPETFLLLRVSIVCYIHDECWEIAAPTWEDFHQSNAMLMTNALTLIRRATPILPFIVTPLRVYRAATYYNFVDFLGAPIFWEYKRSQGFDGVVP